MADNKMYHSDDVLAHYGVRGQKWYRRRYQNEDGTLTSEGKKRYGKTQEQRDSEYQKKNDAKNRGTFSNVELKDKIERIKLEKELRELTRSEISPGKKFVTDIMKDVGTKTLTTALTGASLYAMKAAVSKEFNKKELGEAIFNGGAKKK